MNKGFFGRFGPAVVAVIAAVLTAILSGLTDGFSDLEIVLTVTAGVNAFGVWLIPLLPGWTWGKTAVAAANAGLAVAATAVFGGFTMSEIIMIALAVLGVFGVAGAVRTGNADSLGLMRTHEVAQDGHGLVVRADNSAATPHTT